MPQNHSPAELAGQFTDHVPCQLVGAGIVERVSVVNSDVDHHRLECGTRQRH